MNDNDADKKLQQNTARATGLSAMRKLRKIVDQIEEQESRDRKHLYIISIITAVLITTAAYYITSHDYNLDSAARLESDTLQQ